MRSTRRWTDEDLVHAVSISLSYRQVITRLGLVPAGGNYQSIQRRIGELNIATGHFTGKVWNKLPFGNSIYRKSIDEVLVKKGTTQSYKLKRRLIKAGLKEQACELCGWAQRSIDGRIPVELDHINGDRFDNRIENLRILCPNCHSLQLTHRGKNIGMLR